MKLHLPKALAAALAAVYALTPPLATTLATGTLTLAALSQQAEASEQAFEQVLTEKTTYNKDDDTTYSGLILTWDAVLGSQNAEISNANAKYSIYKYDADTDTMVSDNNGGSYYKGSGTNYNIGDDTNSQPFWYLFAGTSSAMTINVYGYGNTLRLVGATSGQTKALTTNFGPVSYGGFITEGAGSYTLGRSSNNGVDAQLWAADGAGVNMNIGANFTLQYNTYAVNSGGTWYVADGKQLTFSKVVNAATGLVTLADNVAVNLTGAGNVVFNYGVTMGTGASITKSGTGTLTFNGDVAGSISMTNGTMNVNSAMSGNVAVNGGTLNVNADVSADVALTGGTMNVNSAMSGNVAVNGGTLNVNADVGGVSLQTNTLSLGSGAVIGSLATVADPEAVGTTAYTLTNGSGPVTINALTVAENTSLTVTGDLKINNSIVLDGSLTVSEHIVLDTLANLDLVKDSEDNPIISYYDRLSPSSTSGYESAVYSIYSGSGTLTYDKSCVQVLVDGSEPIEYEIDTNGQIRVGESSGRYFINDGDPVVYGADGNQVASATTKVIVLNGGTLELSRNLSGQTLSLAASSTLQIDKGVSIAAKKLPSLADPNVVLNVIGSGTINLGDNLSFNNDNLSIGTGWTGNIRITGVEFSWTDSIKQINDLPRGNGWIELVDCTGALAGYQAVDAVTANVRLTNGAEGYAIKVNNGSNGNFSGKIAGTGTIIIDNDNGTVGQNNCTFTGDISEWTGLFSYERTKYNTYELKLNGTSNIKADINATGDDNNTLTVYIGGGSGTRNISSHIYQEGSGNHTIILSLHDNSLKVFTAESDVEVNEFKTTGGAATVDGKLTVLGTLKSESAVTVNGTFVGGEGFIKAGSANVILGSNTTLSKTQINAGTLQVKASTAAMNFGEITLGGGNFSVYDGSHIESSYHTISKLTVSSSTSQLQATSHRALLDIQQLVLGDNTLLIKDDHSSDRCSVFRFSGDAAGAGTIDVAQTNNGNYRHVIVSLAGTGTLADTVVNFSQRSSGSANLAVAVSTDEAKVAALDNVNSSGTPNEFGAAQYLISRADVTTATGLTDSKATSSTSDSVFRTLVITGDGSTHTYSGHVMDHVNIVMGYDGMTESGSTQVFNGDCSNFNGSITVNYGTLTFTQAIGSESSAASTVSVAAGSTLNMTTGTITDLDVAGTLNMTTGTITNLDVAGTINMTGGTVANLDVDGTLNLTSGTLAVTNILALGQALNITAGATLNLENISLIDLTGLQGNENGNTTAFSLISGTYADQMINGLSSTIDLSMLRVNGIGWTSASYANGVITLTREGAMLTWDSDTPTDWVTSTLFNTDTGTSTASDTSNVTITVENAQLNLVEDITLAGLDVDENKSLTLTTGTGVDAKSLSVTNINLEKNAALDASAITLKADNIDLSSGSVLTLGAISGITDGTQPIYTGRGTLKVDFGENTGTVSMNAASVFVGTVNVTGGTVDLSGSAISQGTWKLDNGVNASLSGEVANNIILDGTTHNFSVAQDGTATIAGTIGGTGEKNATSGLTKTGAGALTLSGTVDLTSMTVSEGSMTLSGAATLGSATVNGNAASLTLSGNTTVNTSLTNNGNLALSGATTVCTATTDAETGETTYSGSLTNSGTLVFGADSVTTLNDFSTTSTVTINTGATLIVNGTLDVGSGVTIGGTTLCTAETQGTKADGSGANDAAYISYNFTGGENFTKSGDGNLILRAKDGTKVNLTNTTLTGGTLQILAFDGNFGNFTLAGGTLSLAALGTRSTYTLGVNLVDAEGTAHDGTINTCVFDINLTLNKLNLGGRTLTINDGTRNAHSTITFTGNSAGSGTIKVEQTDANRAMSLMLAGENTLVSAKLDLKLKPKNDKRVSVIVTQDNVKLGALSSYKDAPTYDTEYYLISHASAGNNANPNTASDSTVRTLTLLGVGAETNTFTGTVGANLNIVMGDETTHADAVQIFSGNVNNFNGNITVNKGTLSFGGTISNAKTVTINGGSLELANNASFATLAGTGGSLVNTATSGNALTLTLTGEGGTYAGSVSNFNIALEGTATGTHAFTGTVSGVDSVSVAGGTLDLTTSASAGRTLELNTLTLSGGALVNGTTTADSQGTITIANNGTLTATGGTLQNTDLTVDVSQVIGNTLSTAIINGSLTVNEADQGETPTVLTLNSSAAMHLNNLTTTANIQLNTDMTVSSSITLDGGGEINFGNEKMLIYNGYTFTNLDLLEDTDGNVGKLEVTYEGEGASQTKNVLAEGLRVMRTSTGASTLAYKMTDVKFVNGEGAGDTTLTATGNTFTDIIVAGGTLTIGADTGVTTVSGDVTMTSRSATLTVENGASLSNGVITLSGLNGSLVINNGETNASVFYGGGTEYSAANITDATVGIASGITGDGDPYVWGAQLVNSTLTTSGNVELFNTAAHSLYELTISSDTLRLNGNLTVQSQGVGATTATDGDITLGAGAKLVMENNGVLTNTLTNGTVITIAGKDTDDIDYDSTITNTTANSVTLGALGAGLEIAYSIVTVNANGNTVNTAVTLDNSTLEVIGGTATASVATGSTNDFHALDGDMTVSVTTEGEQAAVANIGTLQVTGTGKTATFAKAGEANTYASINLQGDGSVIEAGNAVVAETVTVKGATAAEGENPAVPGATLKVTASASDMAHVVGNLTVEGGGTLAVAGATANMPAVQVDNLLTLKEGAVLNLKDVAVTGETATIAVAKANQVAGESAVLNTGDTISGLVVVTDASYHATNVYTGSAMARSTDTYVYADLEKNKITGYSIDVSGTLHLTTNISSGTDMSAYTDLSFVFETGVLAQLMNANLGDQVNVSLCYSGAGGTQGAVIDIQNGATVSFNGYAGANDAATNAVWTDNVGTYYVGENIPEPTTGTLGVLALAALAARRRRKK